MRSLHKATCPLALLLALVASAPACAQSGVQDAGDEGVAPAEPVLPTPWAEVRPDPSLLPPVAETTLAREGRLFLSFWEGMTRAEYAYVARNHVENPLFTPGPTGQPDTFHLLGMPMTVEPEFNGDSLVAVRLEGHPTTFEDVRGVLRLYTSKYSRPGAPLHDRSSAYFRRLWGGICGGRSEHRPSTGEELLDAMRMPACVGSSPAFLPGDGTSWTDAARVVTLDFAGLTRDPDGPFGRVTTLMLRYTSRSRAAHEERTEGTVGRRAWGDVRAREEIRLGEVRRAEAEGI